MDAGESVTIGDVKVEAVKSTHGPIVIPILWFKIKQAPGLGVRAGLGSIGFKIIVDGKMILNLGDSLLLKEWEGLKPDVLMLPIGGMGNNTWTMDVSDALEAVEYITPKTVIPCHYSVPFLWKKVFAPADVLHFKNEVEKMGVECKIMQYGDELIM